MINLKETGKSQALTKKDDNQNYDTQSTIISRDNSLKGPLLIDIAFYLTTAASYNRTVNFP